MTTTTNTIRPKAWLLQTVGPLERLRAVMDAWITQQPHVIRIDSRTGNPFEEFAYKLHNTLQADDLDAARATIADKDKHPVWRKCARRHMLVAAANGDRWDYGDPPPEREW